MIQGRGIRVINLKNTQFEEFYIFDFEHKIAYSKLLDICHILNDESIDFYKKVLNEGKIEVGSIHFIATDLDFEILITHEVSIIRYAAKLKLQEKLDEIQNRSKN